MEVSLALECIGVTTTVNFAFGTQPEKANAAHRMNSCTFCRPTQYCRCAPRQICVHFLPKRYINIIKQSLVWGSIANLREAHFKITCYRPQLKMKR